MNKDKVQSWLDWLTSKWWFYAILILIQFLPPIAEKGFGAAGLPKFLAFHIMDNLMRAPEVAAWYTFAKALAIAIFIFVIMFGNKASRTFSIYAGIAYLFFNAMQNISISAEYGVGVLTQNMVTMLLISLCWFWEAYAGKNDMSSAKVDWVKIVVVLLAFTAFWDPINPVTKGVDFSPVLLWTNAAGLAFCKMTPVFLATLIWFYPKVNFSLLRVNSFAGIVIGIFNVMIVFANPSLYWWFGVLHIQLFVLGIYGLWLGMRKG